MSGQQPWQAPDGRRYSSGQGSPSSAPPRPPGRPERPRKNKPENESRLVSFREWLSTTAGAISAICAIITLIGGTVVVVKILDKNPTTVTRGPNQTPPNTHTSPEPIIHKSPGPFDSAQLQSALLSSDAVGSAAIVASTSTDLSQISGTCGVPLSGDTATAYETIQDQQSGTVLTETLVSWDSAADAGQAITNNRQAVDQSGSCSITSNGATGQYTGDYAGSPPPSCVNPGQYFATQIKVSFPSSTFPYFGFVVQAQCGATTIFIRVYNDQPGAITQQVANGYLSSAVSKLE